MSWKLDFQQLTPQQTRVILVRHGQSSFNTEGRYQGSSDESVLTELGRETARQTGAFLSGLTIDAVYVSSLRRARSTASEMLTQMQPSIAPANIHVDRFPEDYYCWKQHPDQFIMVDPHTNLPSYPVRDLYARSNQFWQDTLPRHQGETILLVSHAGTIRSLISTASNLSPADYHSLRQSNCGMSVMKFSQGSEPQLEVLNYTEHLTQQVQTAKV